MKSRSAPQTSRLVHLFLPALVLLLTIFAAPAATAQILYSNPADITIYPDFPVNLGPPTAIYFDLNPPNGGTLASTAVFAGNDFVLYFNHGDVRFGAILGDSPRYSAVEFQAGDTISSGMINIGVGSAAINFLQLGSTNYMGLSLNNGANVGWAQISYNNDGTLTLYDFAYNATPSESIAAGAVPEPSTYATLFGLSVLGFAAYRKRNQSV